ncbi:protein eiger [Zeugodacus cucurbitae]|uniref:protein eiger n=1 Tax=Zeugodacus cucurbitae TaxID=28588 RepID=UPI0023D8F68F|nr:protein eiger [Zeugodacus cucurbitae]
MTMETLKPFLSTSPRVDSVTTIRLSTASHCQPGINLKSIIFSTLAVILFVCLFGFMYAHFRRITQIETKVQHLTRIMLNMQTRMGLMNLDEVSDFENENDPVFIDQPNISDTGRIKLIGRHIQYTVGDDDYEKELDYTEFRNELPTISDIIKDDSKGNGNVNNHNLMEISDYGDLYNDFSKFNTSRKKNTSARNPRAIESDLFNQDNEKRKSAGVRESAGEEHLEYLNHPKKMVILRLSHKELTDVKNEQNILPNEDKTPKQSHRRGTNQRRIKNSILKKAKSGRQMEAVVNTPAAHFHLNRKIPDRFASIKIDSFSGDMYIGHPSWSNEIDVDKYFKVESGVLTVYEPGLYYVYAQVCYNNTHDQNGFVIFHGHKPFLQCLNTVPTNMPHKIHTCHTSGLIYLKEHETIHLRDFHSERNAILKDANNRSYFGLIKI